MLRAAFSVHSAIVMARAVDFPGANLTLRPPKSLEGEIPSIRVLSTPQATVSRWEFTPAERAEIERSGSIYVVVLDGSGSQPPMIVGTREAVRAVLAARGTTLDDNDNENEGRTTDDDETDRRGSRRR